MPRTHPPYAPEYRRRIIELARTGRPIAQLARPAFFTWRWCSILSAAESSVGRWKLICAPNWCCKRLICPCGSVGPPP